MISGRFRSAYSNGIVGVSMDVQKCFDDGGNDIKNLRACMLYDISAMKLDMGVRKIFESKTGRDVGPGTDFFSLGAFNARMNRYSAAAFGGSEENAFKYFGDAPERVLSRLND